MLAPRLEFIHDIRVLREIRGSLHSAKELRAYEKSRGFAGRGCIVLLA